MAIVRGTAEARGELVELPVGPGLWDRVFGVASLVLVGTRESDRWDFAPKHMAMPLGWEGFYCFVVHATACDLPQCRRRIHSSRSASRGLSRSSSRASLREVGSRRVEKPSLAVPTDEHQRAIVDGAIVDGCPFYLECELERVVDGFGLNSLVVGRVVAASAAREALRGADVDDADLVHRLGLLAYLAPGRFAVVRESLSFPLPADFRR